MRKVMGKPPKIKVKSARQVAREMRALIVERDELLTAPSMCTGTIGGYLAQLSDKERADYSLHMRHASLTYAYNKGIALLTKIKGPA